MRRPSRVIASGPARLRRSTSLVMALLLAMLSAASLRAQAAIGQAAGDPIAALLPGSTPASLEVDANDLEPAELLKDPPRHGDADTALASALGSHAPVVAAGLIGLASAWSDHPSLRSHRVAPPIRPPCPRAP